MFTSTAMASEFFTEGVKIRLVEELKFPLHAASDGPEALECGLASGPVGCAAHPDGLPFMIGENLRKCRPEQLDPGEPLFWSHDIPAIALEWRSV